MNSKEVMVVGIGMNGSETLTEYAKKLLNQLIFLSEQKEYLNALNI